MKNRIRKNFSLFMLIIFLSPMITMEIHNFEHRNDFHCNELSFHFHTLKHHCSLCDFVAPTLAFTDNLSLETILPIDSFLNCETPIIDHSSLAHYNLSLRAPPIA